MAYGDVSLITVSYTSNASNSTRKLYPIKRKYKQIDRLNNPLFPSSYELYDAAYYWFPYDELNVADDDYIVYEAGDEINWQESARKHKPAIAKASPDLKKYDLIDVGTRIYYANNIYEATAYYFNWTDTNLGANKNPYKTNRVNKWRRFDDLSNDWIQYWYHPFFKRFYPLEDSSVVLEISDPGDFDQEKWDLFIGDTNGMNLQNMTTSQIDELIAEGLSAGAAAAAVANIDNKVVASNVSDTTPLENTTRQLLDSVAHSDPRSEVGKPITAAVMPRGGITAGGNNRRDRVRPSGVSNPPTMIQEYKNPINGEQRRARFVFDYAPNNISYSNIGSTWTEIERVNNAPIVDFKNFKHMKISFEFVVSDKTGGISSLYTSCEDQLFLLRQMAARPEFVRFVNFDTLFSKFLIYPKLLPNGNNTAFAIVDMSISSVQRTRADNTTGYSGEISRATVNMTVQEVSTSSPDLIIMPRMVAAPLNPGKPGNGPGDVETCVELLTSTDGVTGKAATPKKCV